MCLASDAPTSDRRVLLSLSPNPRLTPQAAHVPFREALKVWLRVAALSFGGPAGQIAVMHRILVEEKKWVSESRFLHALNYCMLLPGPEAQQLATYIGWLLHRTAGGIVAGGLFVLPGFVSILLLSYLYVLGRGVAVVEGLFYGLGPAVIAVVVEAVLRIGKKVLKNRVMVGLAAAAFVGIFFFNVPFPVIVLSAGLLGYLGGRFWPGWFVVIKMPNADPRATSTAPTFIADHHVVDHTRPSVGRALGVASVWLALWWGPIGLLTAWLGPGHVLVQESLFFSKTAVVTFGGAYSVLSYIAQQAVDVYNWLEPTQMLDGLGMAETTPGPLIQVVQFVGFMGAYHAAQRGQVTGLSPLWVATAASVLVTWVTFIPCFLWIFLGAPYIEKLRGHTLLTAALSAITAAVVGVVLNLAVWFSLHTVFAVVSEHTLGPLRLLVPGGASVNWVKLLIAAGACFVMFRLHWGMAKTLALGAACGVGYVLLRPLLN